MAAPTNTYNSLTELSLGQIPQVDDPELYIALLDLHNALEAVITASDDGDAVFTAYIAKQRNNTPVSGDYTVLVTDGTIEVDASAGNITITLHPVSEGLGFRYNIKRIDLVPSNTVTLLGGSSELVDDRASGIKISTKSSYTVKTNDDADGWNII